MFFKVRRYTFLALLVTVVDDVIKYGGLTITVGLNRLLNYACVLINLSNIYMDSILLHLCPIFET